MNYTQKTHHLPSTWEAQDHANSAQQSAIAAQNYYRLVSQKVSLLQSEIDALRLENQTFKRELNRVEKNSNELRNTALMWGVTSAIVAGCLFQLIASPNPQPQDQIRPSTQYRIGK